MRHVHHQLRAYLDGELPPAEQHTVNAHLAGCPACAAELAALREQAAEVTARLSAADPAAAPQVRVALARFHTAMTSEHPERVDGSRLITVSRQPKDAAPNLSALTRSFDMLRERLTGPRLRPLMIGLTAVVCLALLFTIVPVREAAADFLGLFRVRKFAAIPINPDQVDRLEGLMNDAENVLGEPTVTRPEGERQNVNDATQASALAGFTVRVPTALPDGAVLQEFVVQAGPAAHYEVQRTTVEALLQAAGASAAGLPQVDVLSVDVDMGAGVTQTYRILQGGNGEINFLQTPNPNVALPEGLDMVALSETGFQLLGIAPDEARRLATTIDWSNTLVIPMPTDAARAQEVNIDGTTGLLMQETPGERYDAHPGIVLLWERNDIVYALQASNVEPAALLRVADSLQ